MEHVRTRDDNSSLRPTETSAAPLIQADPSLLTPNRREFDAEYPPWYSLPPSTASLHCADKSRPLRPEPPRTKRLFRGFERPSFSRIVALTVLCFVAYPAFYILTLVAKNKSLSIVQLIVSAWCSVVGFALGYILLGIAAQHLEAASEFILVTYPYFLRPYPKQPGPPWFT